MTYQGFFEEMTSDRSRSPFPWQVRLAEKDWPELLDIPTGLGKTAGVVGAWLFKRLRGDAETGRRLVYCLPMRALVRQVEHDCREWCERAGPAFSEQDRPVPSVQVLMGGETDRAWELSPEADTILVGTQDMLLSRALCRGYGMSRARWPIAFGLLSADCLWVLDETQLMGVGVETSGQLQALREILGTFGAAHTLCMSATLDRRRLDTVDRAALGREPQIARLTDEDRKVEVVTSRLEARKRLVREEGFQLEKDDAAYAKALAARAASLHRERGGLTLVIVNRVDRAQAVFGALEKNRGADSPRALVHSRFRGEDRSAAEALLFAAGDRIVVATQAVEAGIDVSARTMLTELCPFSSLVQRFGRLNRYGSEEDALAVWVDVATAGGKAGDLALPYSSAELAEARDILNELSDAGPAALGQVAYEPPLPVRPVLRMKDLLDLFDTTPDLLGFDLDVSRYVRDGDDTDVLFIWRDFEGDRPPPEEREAAAEEICRVSIGRARGLLKAMDRIRKKQSTKEDRARLSAWRWSFLDGEFQAVQDGPRPGENLLLHVSAGGYDPAMGFTGKVGNEVPAVPAASAGARDAMDEDPRSSIGRWVPLGEHVGHVADEARALAEALSLSAEFARALAEAATWHDVGKAHPEFQRRLLEPVADDPDRPPGEGPWAKSDHRLRAKDGRPGFRHELASALAWLQGGRSDDPRFRDLVAYLVASHHGKVRLSIRSLPTEREPDPDPERLFARGVWDGDTLPELDLPDGTRIGPLSLDLSPVRMGEGSWLERALALRDAADLGPFRLAYLETVLRISDWRASAGEERNGDA